MEDRWSYKIKRMKKNIKQKEVAEFVGVSIPMISKYENGERNMSFEKVQKYRSYIDNF